jgi:hypothetical protein
MTFPQISLGNLKEDGLFSAFTKCCLHNTRSKALPVEQVFLFFFCEEKIKYLI